MNYNFCCFIFFFFKQKTAYEITRRDWSSDVCSSELARVLAARTALIAAGATVLAPCPHAGSEERRVGKECALLCRSRGSPYHEKKKRRVIVLVRHDVVVGLKGLKILGQ